MTCFKTLMITIAILLTGVTGSLSQDFRKGLYALNNADYATALREFRPLAEQGDADAQGYLGSMYVTGDGVARDFAEAEFWFRKSTEQGNAYSQLNLGMMHLYGDGVLQDNVYAYMWFNIAASNGSEDAIGHRKQVATKMTASQIAEAQKLARECVQKNYKGC